MTAAFCGLQAWLFSVTGIIALLRYYDFKSFQSHADASLSRSLGCPATRLSKFRNSNFRDLSHLKLAVTPSFIPVLRHYGDSSAAHSAAPCAHLPCVPTGPVVCGSFCPWCSRCWLAIISGCVLCYPRATEPRHNNARTEASHALRQHDSAKPQWLAHIQLAQLLFDWQLCFLVFARSSMLVGTLLLHFSRVSFSD